MKEKIVIGIDQSYTDTGITVLKNKTKILLMESIKLSKYKNNSEKRTILRNRLLTIVKKYEMTNPLVITERIRLKSQGFINQDYLMSTGALVSAIIDFFYYYNNIPVYSVDTRSWKSQVVGSSKPLSNPYGINPEKYRTILYLKNKGLLKYIVEEYRGRGKKGVIQVKMNGQRVPCKINDNIADSYCIAEYGFLPESRQSLKEEHI